MKKIKVERVSVKKPAIEFFDILFLAGLAMISIGLFLMYKPLAWLFWGVVLVIIAAAFELPSRKKKG